MNEGVRETHAELDRLFRRQAAKLHASLTRVLGPARLPLVECVVQEALLRALGSWPIDGIPDNPAGWIHQAARNLAIDAIRRENLGAKLEREITDALYDPDRARSPGVEARDELTLLFICAHPELALESQVALMLKTLCGLGIGEIARAFLLPEATVQRRLHRAKERIRERGLPFELPEAEELELRREAVQRAIYLVFNEGYAATRGDSPVRRELCDEAIRLAELLAWHPAGDHPSTRALLALFWLQSSRLPARVRPTRSGGELVLLGEQDRSRWDLARIERGMRELARAGQGDELTSYHLEAAIAACHALAPSTESTDWSRIIDAYDGLLALGAGPVAALNRAVAVGMREGPQAGLREIEALLEDAGAAERLRRYPMLQAARGELLRRAGAPRLAAESFRAALELGGNEAERKFLKRRLNECEEDPPK